MKKILIASAKTEHLIMLSNMLHRRGYVPISCPDADFALSLLRQGMQIDAVITDYEIAGFHRLVKAMRAHTPFSPPVIVMSDRVAVSDYLTALSAGAFEVFFWPVSNVEVLRIIEAAVGQNKNPSAGIGRHHDAARFDQAVRY